MDVITFKTFPFLMYNKISTKVRIRPTQSCVRTLQPWGRVSSSLGDFSERTFNKSLASVIHCIHMYKTLFNHGSLNSYKLADFNEGNEYKQKHIYNYINENVGKEQSTSQA